MPDVCVVTFTSPSADTTPIGGPSLPGPVPLSPLHATTRTVAAKGRTLARLGFDLPRSIVMEPSLSRRQPRRQRATACDAAPPFGPLALLTAEVFAFIGTDVDLSLRPR